MLGVVSLRGSLASVYSPASTLGQALVSGTAALIFWTGSRRVGVAVDEVEDALVVEEHQLRELPGADDDVIVGVVQHEGQLISVMRAAALVSACRDGRAVATT
jgi:chemotaxis signal transduction protein